MRQILGQVGIAVVLFAASIPFDNPTERSAPGMVPYFSGSANFELGRGWVYTEEDIARFVELPSREARENYRFQPSDDVKPYDFAAQGYVYVSLAARNLFFWMGDVKAVETLQVLVHIAIVLFVMSRLRRRLSKLLFLVIYGLNPLMYWVATLPIYYFWQAVPGAIVAAYLLDRRMQVGWYVLAVAVLLGFIYAVRPTVLFLCGFFFLLVLLRESWRPAAAGAVAFAVFGILVFGGNDHRTDPWHTAYVGLASYPNPYVQEWHDRAAHRLWEEKSGEKLDKGPYGNYRKPGVLEETSEVKREAFLEIAFENPGMLIRNAMLNFFESYSVGYVRASLTATYASAALGLVYVAILALCRKWGFLFALAAASGSFVLFYPPIQIYMYGSYVLLVAAFLDLVRDLPVYERWSKSLPELPGLEDSASGRV